MPRSVTPRRPESYVDEVDGKKPDLPRIRKRLQRVRDQGFEVSRDELIKGAVAVAVPVFLGNGQVVGSLAVFGPGVRVDEERVAVFEQLLKAESRKLSQALGQADAAAGQEPAQA